jgi:hypothetical protein
MPPVVTDRNYWATYRQSITLWGGALPPPATLGVQRVFEFARHVLDAAEREQVMRVVLLPTRSATRKERAPTWFEHIHTRFEQRGHLKLFPHGADAWLGDSLRQPARLAYYQGEQIVEEDIEDVGTLEKAVVSARGGDPHSIRSTLPIVLGGGSPDEEGEAPGRPPTREFPIYLALYTDIWFPRVTGLDVGDHVGRDPKARHPARGRDGLMDNSELAARHTPRLNRFIATLRDAILELGGTWKLDRSGAPHHHLPVLHDGGILLDHPSASA